MADLDTDPHVHAPPRHDGSPSCALCATTAHSAGHDWCLAAQCLVCDDCCRNLVDGDASRLLAVVMSTGRTVTPAILFGGCSMCPRGHVRYVERMLAQAPSEKDHPSS
jgi:hypothetical protein